MNLQEKELSITFENFCLAMKGKLGCVRVPSSFSLVFLKDGRVQAQVLPPQRKGNDEPPKEPS